MFGQYPIGNPDAVCTCLCTEDLSIDISHKNCSSSVLRLTKEIYNTKISIIGSTATPPLPTQPTNVETTTDITTTATCGRSALESSMTTGMTATGGVRQGGQRENHSLGLIKK